jgi:hypothetical protein
VAIEDRWSASGEPLGNHPPDQHEHGLHGYAWGLTNGEGGAMSDFNRWRYGDGLLVLDVAERDLVHDKRRTTGRCRVKRGTVRYLGDLAGAVAFMRERWPKRAGPAPAWEDDPMLFPPLRPEPPEPRWKLNRPGGWLVPDW